MGSRVRLLIGAAGVALLPLTSLSTAVQWIHPGQGGGARSSAVSSTLIATGGDDGSIHLWNLQTHGFVKSLPGHSGTINDLAFSPDGAFLASASADGSVRLDNIASGDGEIIVSTPGYQQFGVAFQTQSNRLVTLSINGDVSFWNLNDKLLAGKISTGSSATRLALAPSGQCIAVASGSQIKLRSLATGSTRTLIAHTEQVQSLAFSPDSATLISGAGSSYSSSDPIIRIWNVATGAEAGALNGHDAGIRSVAFAPNPNYLVSVGFDQTIIFWDLLTRKPIGSQQFNNPESLSISTDAKWVVSGSQIFTVSDRSVSNLVSHVLPIQSLAFNADGTLLVSDDNLEPRVWDAKTGELVHDLAFEENPPNPQYPGAERIGRVGLPISFSPDGQVVLAQDRLWSLDTGEVILRLPRSAHAVAPDWSSFVTAAYDTDIARLFSFPYGTPLVSLTNDITQSSSALAFSPSGNLIAAAGGYSGPFRDIDPTIRIWRTGAATSEMEIENDQIQPDAIAFSADERFIASSSEVAGAEFSVWKADTRERVLNLGDKTNFVSSFAFFPDSKRIAWGHGSTVEIWSIETSTRETTLTNEVRSVSALAISPDGASLAIGRMDGTVLVVPAPEATSIQLGTPPRVLDFTFRFPTVVGANYTVEHTTDFKTWTPVQTFTATAYDSEVPFRSAEQYGFLRLRQE